MPCKKGAGLDSGRRNNSVATLLAVVTEIGCFVLSSGLLSVADRQPDLYDLAGFIDSGSVDFGIGLGSDKRQRHQRHDSQADYFVEVSYKY